MIINYINNKLVLGEPTCNCDYHNKIECDIYIGNGIINNINSYIEQKITGEKCLIVTDENLYNLFGDKIINILNKKYNVSVCIPNQVGKLKPNQYALGEVLMAIDNDTDFLIALGSGTINDITRYVAFNCNLDFVSIGTSPSMDGYLSVVAPMLKDNLKINKPAKYPEVCIFDLDILKTSPLDMLYAGFGDVIGKYIAKADWILSNTITNEHICPYCLEIIDEAIKLCEDNVKNIKEKNDIGIKSLLEALLLTGLAMLLNGDSRPAASNEHNMGHFWEMKKLSQNKSHPSHGAAVSVATLYCLDVYKEFFKYDFDNVSIQNLLDNKLTDEKRVLNILSAYGDDIGKSIINDNKDEPISISEQKRRISNFLDNKDNIITKLDFLPPKEKIISMYKILNGAINANQINIEPTLLKQSLLYAKDYRSRYNIFKLAEEFNILEQIID